MNKLSKRIIITVLLLAATQLSFGQYSQHLFDNDSTYDWGWSILNKPDNTYFIMGWSQNSTSGFYSMFNMNISSDGGSKLALKELKSDSMTVGQGSPGDIKITADGSYILPFGKQWLNPGTGYLYSAGGIIKYDASGDTIFTRTYTDTSVYFDIMYACAIMPNGDYLVGGVHALNTPSYAPAYIIRVNRDGDTVWTHTYQKDFGQSTTINTLAALPNGHILVGARTRRPEHPSYVYYCDVPWFMELDSAGTIVKDTLYNEGYAFEGRIYKDSLGGYFHVGSFDSLVTEYPNDEVNFPNYIAHLDTNFRIDWITDFVINTHYNHRYIENVKQLHDGNFLVIGEMSYQLSSLGWAAKVDRNGRILWNHYYASDTDHYGYFRDVAEQSNGDLTFVGATYNDTLPSWHQGQDIWIVRADSNGCIMSGGCDPDTGTAVTFVPAVQKQSEPLSIFPNPTTGTVNVRSADKGKLLVYTITGQLAVTYIIQPGTTELQLPATLSTGIYMCRYVPDDGGKPQTVLRLVYER